MARRKRLLHYQQNDSMSSNVYIQVSPLTGHLAGRHPISSACSPTLPFTHDLHCLLSQLISLPIPHPMISFPCLLHQISKGHTIQSRKKPTKNPKQTRAPEQRILPPLTDSIQGGWGFTRLQRLSSFCSSKQKRSSIRWTITRKAWRKIE